MQKHKEMGNPTTIDEVYKYIDDPAGRQCHCCGKSFTRLFRTFRQEFPYIQEIENFFRICRPGEDPSKVQKLLVEKHGEEMVEVMSEMKAMFSGVSRSWECQDCVVLNTTEWWDKHNGCGTDFTTEDSQTAMEEDVRNFDDLYPYLLEIIRR